MRTQASARSRYRGQSLVGLLAVVFILIALYMLFFSGGKVGTDTNSTKSLAKQSIEKGDSVQVMSNLNQIRQVITMYKSDNEGKAPASLDELKKYAKFPDEMWINPVDKRPLQYDPATGRIWCDSPGMENL